jgi:inosine-uridine nucleoside N-ribohydrolase
VAISPVVVCDPGVDDMLALMVLVGAGAPPSAIVATAGNVDAEVSYRNAAGIAALLGVECPITRGVAVGLTGPYPDTGEPFHGPDGLGGVSPVLPATSTPDTSPNPIELMKGSILATGPLTMVAQALSAEQAISDMVWMGGAVSHGGNMTASAEFNAWLDPEACDQVLASGVPIAMIPLDVTHQVGLEPADLATMAEFGDVAGLAARACSYIHERDNLVFPHDAVAAVALLSPELFEWEERWARCELLGTWTRGMTVVDRRGRGERGSVRVARGVDVTGVKERIFEALRALG